MAAHEALAVFVGDWYAEGTNFDPAGNESLWRSVHSARWHSGQFFVVQDERANGPFDTLALLRWNQEAERYFARTIENHGYARDYTMTVDGDTWTFMGGTERATYRFGDESRTQTISWQYLIDGEWKPLCDRVATRVD